MAEHMPRGRRTPYLVTLTVENEPDTLRRISILNAALFRILDAASVNLRRVLSSDYDGGCLELLLEAPDADPSIVPGAVTAKFERAETPAADAA